MQRGLTERAESLDSEIAAAKGELLRLGPLPKHADDTAAKLTRIIGLVVTTGAETDDAIAEWCPIWFAIGIELLAFLGPLGMIAAFTPAGSSNVAKPQQPAIQERPGSSRQIGDKVTPAPEVTGLAQTPATPAKVKKPKKIRSTGLAGVGNVREWFNSRTAARAGVEIRCNEVYSNYVEWCKGRSLEAASLTKFGTLMKGELGVAYVEKSKRGYYAGLVLKGAGLKIVSC